MFCSQPVNRWLLEKVGWAASRAQSLDVEFKTLAGLKLMRCGELCLSTKTRVGATGRRGCLGYIALCKGGKNKELGIFPRR